MQKLPREFYDRDTVTVAQELLGKYLVRKVGNLNRIGRIIEVEAYLGPHDLAAHSAKGRTKRTEVMFGPPGHAYVYLIYGMYHCMNVVTEQEGHASAVLLRALEPIENITSRTQGPGLLCQAMQIDRQLNGWDLLSEGFYVAAEELSSRGLTAGPSVFPQKILDPAVKPRDDNCAPRDDIVIIKRPRIGVDYAGAWAKKLLRFYLKDNAFVSRR